MLLAIVFAGPLVCLLCCCALEVAALQRRWLAWGSLALAWPACVNANMHNALTTPPTPPCPAITANTYTRTHGPQSITFDTYSNLNQGLQQYVSVIIGDGSQEYDHDKDGGDVKLAGCEVSFPPLVRGLARFVGARWPHYERAPCPTLC